MRVTRRCWSLNLQVNLGGWAPWCAPEQPTDAVHSWPLSPSRSGGPRKCVGDQFALMEAVVVLAVLLKKYSFELVPGREVGVTTGATIHTSNGLYMYVRRRGSGGAVTAGSSSSGQEQQAVAAAAAPAVA